MSETAVAFDQVSKRYPMYHHVTGGLKQLLFHLPRSLRSLRAAPYETLREVSFQVRRGETFGIIGKNGAGKSTTLGLIAGVILPSSGRVTVEGRVAPLLELGAGFHPDLTGLENIMLNGVLMGLTRAQVRRKMDEIVAFSELGEFIDQPIRVYSSGMLARLGFSVAAHLDPDVLLVDEVLAVGDLEFQKKCLDAMMGFKRAGVTIVFVSHSMDDVLKICDRVLWMKDHVVHRIGAPQEIVAAYAAHP